MGTGSRRYERSRDHRMVAGVCGGIALSSGASPGAVRLGFLLLVLVTSGLGALAYLGLWIAMPLEAPPAPTAAGVMDRTERVLTTAEKGVRVAKAAVGLATAIVGGVSAPTLAEKALDVAAAYLKAPVVADSSHSALSLVQPPGRIAPAPRPPRSTPSRPAAPTFEPGLRERLLAVIDRANEVEIEAVRAGDVGLLGEVLAGEAYQTAAATVIALRAAGISREQTLLGRTVQSVRSNGQVAEVHVVERWRVEMRSPTEGCVLVASQRVPQTYHLVRRDDSWLVARIVFDPAPEPQGVPCE